MPYTIPILILLNIFVLHYSLVKCQSSSYTIMDHTGRTASAELIVHSPENAGQVYRIDIHEDYLWITYFNSWVEAGETMTITIENDEYICKRETLLFHGRNKFYASCPLYNSTWIIKTTHGYNATLTLY